MPLDELLAIASGGPEAPVLTPEPVKPIHAVASLGYRRVASPEEESKIAATLAALLSTKDLNAEAAEVLGRRGRMEYLPQLFDRLEGELYLFLRFFSGLQVRQMQRRERIPLEEPAIDILRAALRSPKTETRWRVLSVVGDLKSAALREDVEELLETDPEREVRNVAAYTLGKIGAPQSAAALQRVIERDASNYAAFYALNAVGGDAQVPMLLRLVDSIHRRAALKALSLIHVTDPQPLVEAFVRVLQEEPETPSLSAAAGLARYHDARALPFLRRLVEIQQQDFEDDRTLVRAIANVGGADAIALLNEMVGPSWHKRQRSRGDLETVLAECGDPSSARAVWALYLKYPARRVISGWCATTGGYTDAFRVLAACSDAELLESIRDRSVETTESTERRLLLKVITKIEARLSGEDVAAR